MPEMMTMLACFKDQNFNEERCASSMKALNECISRQVCARSNIARDIDLTLNTAESAIEAEKHSVLSSEATLLHSTAIVTPLFLVTFS